MGWGGADTGGLCPPHAHWLWKNTFLHLRPPPNISVITALCELHFEGFVLRISNYDATEERKKENVPSTFFFHSCLSVTHTCIHTRAHALTQAGSRNQIFMRWAEALVRPYASRRLSSLQRTQASIQPSVTGRAAPPIISSVGPPPSSRHHPGPSTSWKSCGTKAGPIFNAFNPLLITIRPS